MKILASINCVCSKVSLEFSIFVFLIDHCGTFKEVWLLFCLEFEFRRRDPDYNFLPNSSELFRRSLEKLVCEFSSKLFYFLFFTRVFFFLESVFFLTFGKKSKNSSETTRISKSIFLILASALFSNYFSFLDLVFNKLGIFVFVTLFELYLLNN